MSEHETTHDSEAAESGDATASRSLGDRILVELKARPVAWATAAVLLALAPILLKMIFPDATPGVLASRMVGAGFGGCVLVVCDAGQATGAAATIGEKYGAQLGRDPWWHVVRAAPPAQEVLPA